MSTTLPVKSVVSTIFSCSPYMKVLEPTDELSAGASQVTKLARLDNVLTARTAQVLRNANRIEDRLEAGDFVPLACVMWRASGVTSLSETKWLLVPNPPRERIVNESRRDQIQKTPTTTLSESGWASE
jgi:hypothetical protein